MKLYVLIVNQCGIHDHLAVGHDLNTVLTTIQNYPVSKEQCRQFIRIQQLLQNNPGAAFTEYAEYQEDFAMSDTDIYLKEVNIDIPLADIERVVNAITTGMHNGIILDSQEAVQLWLDSLEEMERV